MERKGWTVFKLSIGSYADFICLKYEDGKLKILLVEAKRTESDSYSFSSDRERLQFELIKNICKELKIEAKYYIKTKKKRHIIDVFDMPEVVK